MTTYQVLVEGQTIPVPEEIGSSDETIKRALAPFYPEVANAGLTRSEKDGLITITVVKRAGSKGVLDAMHYLHNCEGGCNPVIALHQQLVALDQAGSVNPLDLLALEVQIDGAIAAGQQEGLTVQHALTRLHAARPQAARGVPLGF